MSLLRGSTATSKVYLGTTAVKRVMLGGTKVWGDVTFGNVGSDSTNAASLSFSKTVTAQASHELVFLTTWITTTGTNATAKVGTTSMTQLKKLGDWGTNSGWYASLYCFVLAAPPTGTQTITITPSQ